jgi:hypothetical protein
MLSLSKSFNARAMVRSCGRDRLVTHLRTNPYAYPAWRLVGVAWSGRDDRLRRLQKILRVSAGSQGVARRFPAGSAGVAAES